MLSVHITAGMLDDFYVALSASYGATGDRVARILGQDDDRQALVAIIAVGVCVGFLPFNFNPARIFMGDSGALLLGLLMAVVTRP